MEQWDGEVMQIYFEIVTRKAARGERLRAVGDVATSDARSGRF